MQLSFHCEVLISKRIRDVLKHTLHTNKAASLKSMGSSTACRME